VWAEALRDERIRQIVSDGFDEPLEVLTDLIKRAQRDGTFPKNADAAAGARVCASLFYGLVLQQAWDPSVDVGAYMKAVGVILDRLTR
jgi:hypothetical protein